MSRVFRQGNAGGSAPPVPQPQSSQVPFMGTCSFRLISPPMKYCPQPQRSQRSTGAIAPFRLISAQMRYPPQAVICASSTGGHRRFVPAIGGCYMTCWANNFPQLQEGRRELFPGRPASLPGNSPGVFQASGAVCLFILSPNIAVQGSRGAVSRRRLWRMQAGEGPMRHRARQPALAAGCWATMPNCGHRFEPY